MNLCEPLPELGLKLLETEHPAFYFFFFPEGWGPGLGFSSVTRI